MKSHAQVVIIGGGAAGYFAAITIAETNPNLKVLILEKSKNVFSPLCICFNILCSITLPHV